MFGRRGNEMVLSVLVQLVILCVIAATFITYIGAKTDNTEYFMAFHAKDLGLLAELGTASPGRLQLNYDNIKLGLPLRFSFRKGLVSVSKIDTKRPELQGYAKSFYYGVPDTFSVIPASYDSPFFLTIVTQGTVFSIKDASGYLRACELGLPAIGRKEIKLHIRLKEGKKTVNSITFLNGARDALAAAMRQDTPVLEHPYPNIQITAIRGTSDGIIISAGKNELSEDAKYLSCLLAGVAKASYPGLEVREAQHDETEKGIVITMAVPSADKMTDTEVGEIIGRGVAIYAR